MIDRWTVLMAVGFLVSCSTRAVHSDPNSPSVLTELSADFSAARAQPLGSRPGPPEVDLTRLIGLRMHLVRAAIGAPDSQEPEMPLCEAARCWSYIYGPGPEPFSDEVQHHGNTDSILVTTGGPFLLILGVAGDRVASAHWLGQR